MTDTGVVLTGGGARAAYQVGVLRAISDMYPDWENPFRVILGTSAGAINAIGLASAGDRFRHSVSHLESLWLKLTADQIYKSQTLDIIRNMTGVALRVFAGSGEGPPGALLNNSPLRKLLEKEIDFEAVHDAIQSGRLGAVGVNACGYSTGQSVCFFEAAETLKAWSLGQRAGSRTVLTVDHILASAAIPTVFPPVQINREYFGDGVTRQMAHISPALRLGAQRVLVIGVSANGVSPVQRPETPPSPTFAQVITQVFNGMFLDTLDYDIERLRLVNQLLELIPEDRLKASGLQLSPVSLLEISPSEPIDEIAAEFMGGMPLVLRNLVGATDAHHGTSSSLASYLLFDPRFCKALIKLGYQDGQSHATQIERFFRAEDQAQKQEGH
ncbi:patatin-like phospholipase family protein [uncultured Marinobacter sp.]|uniref:patatin-like phospholipase family protein n=1 Tax=uncultured Marinobacter sp. TaxID=187379 RepID=UPI0030DBFA81